VYKTFLGVGYLSKVGIETYMAGLQSDLHVHIVVTNILPNSPLDDPVFILYSLPPTTLSTIRTPLPTPSYVSLDWCPISAPLTFLDAFEILRAVATIFLMYVCLSVSPHQNPRFPQQGYVMFEYFFKNIPTKIKFFNI
jgi:hypothetical protein